MLVVDDKNVDEVAKDSEDNPNNEKKHSMKDAVLEVEKEADLDEKKNLLDEIGKENRPHKKRKCASPDMSLPPFVPQNLHPHTKTLPKTVGSSAITTHYGRGVTRKNPAPKKPRPRLKKM